MNYGALISSAFWLALRNPFLWFFGFFLVGGTSFGFNSSFPTEPGTPPNRPAGPPPAWVSDPGRWFSDNLGLILAISALVVLLVLVLISLTILSEGALVESVAALRRGEPRRFSSAWRAGLSYFWHVLGQRTLFFLLSLALLLVIFVPLALVFLVLFSANPESVGLVFLFVFFGVLLAILLLILISIPVYIIGQLALRELVLGGGRVFGSIGSGYGIFRRNLGRSLLVWVIQFAIALGVSIILFITSLLVGLVLFALTSALSTGYATVVAVVIGLLIAIPSIVLSGIIGTFNSSYWTLAYLRLTAPPEGELSQPGQEA